MTAVVTEQTEDGFSPPARVRQRYVGAIERQTRAVARWLEAPELFSSPLADDAVLRCAGRSCELNLDDSDAAEAGTAASQDGREDDEREGEGSDIRALNPVAPSELADMVDSVESLWRDVRPLIDRWQVLLREDPAVHVDKAITTERERLHAGVSRLLYLQSHLLLNISDFIVEFNAAPPRHLLVTAESPTQSMSVSAAPPSAFEGNTRSAMKRKKRRKAHQKDFFIIEENNDREANEPPPPPPPPPPDSREQTFEEIHWECPTCLVSNNINVLFCNTCAAAAPEWVGDLAETLELECRAFSRETERHVTEMQKLFAIDDQDVVETQEHFECPICFTEKAPGEGVRLRGCLHDVCKVCLTQAVEVEESGYLRCGVCNFEIEDRDVIHVVSPELWERRLQRVARLAEAKLENTHHCRRPNCEGFAEVLGGSDFTCPVCSGVTCLRCKAFHPDQDCRQYQAYLNRDADAQRSKEMLEDLLRNGLAMRCSGCQIIVQKDEGCDFLLCGNCGMELCWPTKGPRWGPGGRGDTSGGCRCRINRRKCHPDCYGCH